MSKKGSFNTLSNFIDMEDKAEAPAPRAPQFKSITEEIEKLENEMSVSEELDKIESQIPSEDVEITYSKSKTLREAIIEEASKRKTEEVKSERLQILVKPSTKKRLKNLSYTYKMSVNEIINIAIKKYLEEEK